MPNCAIIICKNSSKTINRGNGDVSYHRFPKDSLIREKWISATGRPNWFPKKNSTVCSEHFDKKYFFMKPSGNKFLRDTAVPEKKIVCFKFDVSKQELCHDETKPGSEPEIDSDEECLENLREKVKREANLKTTPSTYNEKNLVELLRWNEDKVKKQNMKIKQLFEKNRRLKIKINNILGVEADDSQKISRIGLRKARNDSSSSKEERDYKTYHEIGNEIYLMSKIDKIKENSKTEFEKFGCKIAEYLNTIPLKPAVVLQTRLERIINKFKADFDHLDTKNDGKVLKHTRLYSLRTNKTNSTLSQSYIKKSLVNSTNDTFSHTNNRLAHIDDVNLLIDKQEIKVTSTEQFIAYCIQPRLSGKSNMVTIVEHADNLLELNKNTEERENPGTTNEIEVKIEEDDVIVKLEDETPKQTYCDPLNTG